MKAKRHQLSWSLALFLLLFGALAAERPNDFTRVAKEAIPAVVSVKVQFLPQAKSRSPFDSRSPFQDPLEGFKDDFWQRFFDFPGRNQQPEPSYGQGSGFLVGEEGYILTNNHIVRNADTITVVLKDGREFRASLVGRDENTDIAVLKIEAKNLPHLTLGDSNRLEVGQWVVAIGNPLGLQATLTVGIVSAKDRTNLGLAQIENFIQTDAAINRGNSGGPLLNLDGEVVGINTAIATHTGGYMGIGFAIPSSIASKIMDHLVTDGSFTRGYLGVVLQGMTSDLAEAFDLDRIYGAVVSEIAEDSPAERAGVQKGDIILKHDGIEVEDMAQVRNSVAMMAPGETISLTINRGGKLLDLKIKVGSHPSNAFFNGGTLSKLGIKVEKAGIEIKKELGLSDKDGVVITEVEPGSLASMAGIQKGSVILSVNRKAVAKAEEFYQRVSEHDPEKPILFLIRQGGYNHWLSLKVE